MQEVATVIPAVHILATAVLISNPIASIPTLITLAKVSIGFQKNKCTLVMEYLKFLAH